MTIDEMHHAIAEHAEMARVLLDHRRRLFDTLMQTTLALRVAENHLQRDSGYVLDLMARRVPTDMVTRATAVLEDVAYDQRMR